MRDAYMLRVALGRGAESSPEWDGALQSIFEEAAAPAQTSSPHGSPSSRQFQFADPVMRARHRDQRFNDRGYPVNGRTRDADSDHCHAQNVAQQIAADNMPRYITDAQCEEYAGALAGESKLRVRLTDAFLWVEFAARHWLDAASHRWSALRPVGSLPFTRSLTLACSQRGFWSFAFTGFVPYAVVAESHERLEARLDRFDDYWRNVSWPSLSEYLSGATMINLVRVASEVFFFGPLTVWTHLQTLGLLPGLPVLPPYSFFNPLSPLSPFQPAGFAWSLLRSPLAIQVIMDNIDKVVSSHFFIITETIDYKLEAVALRLEEDAEAPHNSNHDTDNDPTTDDWEFASTTEDLRPLTAAEGPTRPHRVWRIVNPAPLPIAHRRAPPNSLLSTAKLQIANFINAVLRYEPRRPSTWRLLDPDHAFLALDLHDDWDAAPYGADHGPSALHHSLTDCADLIWRQISMYPFYMAADALVLRSIARSFLAGALCPGLLPAAADAALGPADVYPVLPDVGWLWRAVRRSPAVGDVALGLGVWRGVRPYAAELALRMCVCVTVCGLHAAVVGVLVRRRTPLMRDALNWRDGGRRQW